ncbi:MAG: DNA replication/repair protein RecF [Candidatus Puniceispirillaceae bacterium]
MPLSDHLSDHHCDVFVRRLTLSRFRNYEQARLDVSHSAGRPVVLIGPNGAGKTNLLEALSLLSPGRGLRRAARADFPHFHSAPASRQSELSAEIMPSPPVWAVSAEFETPLGPLQASTGILPDKPDGARVFRLNGDKSSAGQIASHLALSWLTPQMDGLFIGSPSARRRFIDRLVIAFDPAHSARLSRYEKCYRERQKLLTLDGDTGWIQATECQLAEIGVAIMAARASLVRALSESTYQGDEAFGFPRVHMAMRGGGSQWLDHEPAAIVEDKICQDAAARRLRGDGAMMGPHAQDLDTLHLAKNQPASLASTGEQKSLMIAAILAHARLQDRRLSRPPLLLLDDVAAHLDEAKRACLFAATSELKGQIWYSGTDAHAFTKLQNFAHFLTVVDGKIS